MNNEKINENKRLNKRNWKRSEETGKDRKKLEEIGRNWKRSEAAGRDRKKLEEIGSSWKRSEAAGRDRK